MNPLEKTFLWFLYSSMTSTVIVFVVLLIKKIFKNQLNPRFSHALWILVLIKLLIPFMPESNLSIFNLFPNKSINHITHTTFESNLLAKDQIIENNKEQDETEMNILSKENLPRPNKEKLFSMEKSNLLQRNLKIFSYIWLIGLLVIYIFMFIATLKFKKKTSSFNRVHDSKVIKIINVCKKKLNINKNITVYSGNIFKTPFIYGLLNPKIYIPNNILNTISSHQLLHICLHELVHYKRKDLYFNFFAIIATIIHWFNPIVWFAMKEMRVDRELTCDNYVLEIIGENESIPYGMTIIKLSQIISNQHYKNILSVHFYENKTQIERRITMIKMFKKGSYKISIIAILLFIVFGTTTLTNATSFKDTNKEFIFDMPTKHFSSLNRAIDFVDFEFKVPDNIPEDYKFWRININKENVIDINFEKNKNNETHNFTFLVSQDDIIKQLREQHNTIYKDIKTNIEFDTKRMTLSNINGTNVIIKQNFEWTKDNLKKLQKNNTNNIKHVPLHEIVNKYFVWEDKGIWYAVNYYFGTTTLEKEYHVDELPKKYDLIKIISSLKYPNNIQNTDYVAEKFVKNHLYIYDEKDLEEAAKIIGFIPKFPLTLPGDFVPTSSHTYHFIYEGEENSSTSITTVFQLKDKNISTPKIEFKQTKNTFHYDNLVEQNNYDIKSKTINGNKVLIYEKDSKRYYVWKEEDIVYTVDFIGNIDNEFEIVKTLIQTSV